MDDKHRGGGSSSRFSLRRVSVNQQSAVLVDPGCQRCQHCWMRRQGALSSLTSTSAADQGVSGAFQTGRHPCL
jgi:hypothetical protein